MLIQCLLKLRHVPVKSIRQDDLIAPSPLDDNGARLPFRAYHPDLLPPGKFDGCDVIPKNSLLEQQSSQLDPVREYFYNDHPSDQETARKNGCDGKNEKRGRLLKPQDQQCADSHENKKAYDCKRQINGYEAESTFDHSRMAYTP